MNCAERALQKAEEAASWHPTEGHESLNLTVGELGYILKL